ncbi:autotransporter domain-containing protein [Pandoraea cepalis]|nr:autotransporter domain-containing protein [Pandoraea cepalis]
MLGKSQKVGALRQTKIGMAVAAMVAATAFPTVAVAEVETADVIVQQSKAHIVNVLESQIDEITKVNAEKNDAFIRENTWLSNAEKIQEILKIEVLEKRNAELEGIASRADEMLKLAETGTDGKSLDHVDWMSVEDLKKIKEAANSVVAASEEARAGEIAKFSAFLSRESNIETIKADALALSAKLKNAKETLKTLNVADGQSLHELVNRFELNAEMENGKAKEVGSWAVDNLSGKFADIQKASGGDLVNEKTILEITQRSGAASNPVTGTADSGRRVGTLRLLDGADHRLDVSNGQLILGQGIDGTGKLRIDVGTEGVLVFEKAGQGIQVEANGVEINAGRNTNPSEAGALIAVDAGTSAGGVDVGVREGVSLRIDDEADDHELEEGGLVHFAAGTSAGSARIGIHDSGSLGFEGSDAGSSSISISHGGTASFRDAGAKQSSIANSGSLNFVSSSGADAKIINERGGELMFSASALEGLHLTNRGAADLQATSGGEATIVNEVDGELAFGGASLDKLKLDNEGTASISHAFGGDATLHNRAVGRMAIIDTALENVRLSNEGWVGLVGETTADNAVVKMSGGMLDVSLVEKVADESNAVEKGTEKAITIGSLSGTGDVITGATQVTLGSANQDDEFGGRFMKTVAITEPQVEGEATTETTESVALRTPAVAQTTQGVQLTKIGTGNLTLTGDQSDVDRLSIQGGKLTAAHANALGSGTVSVAGTGTIALAADVSGVTDLTNAGTLDLGTNKLVVRKYASSEGAKINSRVAKLGDDLAFGAIQVSESSDFRTTKIKVAVDDGIEVTDLLKQKVTVVDAQGDAEVQIGEVEFGSISTDVDTGTDTDTDTGVDTGVDIDTGTGGQVTITETSAVNFLGADGGYSANEQAMLASVDGVALGDLASGKIGGKVLSAMALQTAGSEEQRRSARLLSGESLVNNATAAQGAATSFQRGMQTRMIAGGSMFDDQTTNGAMASDNGIAGWASFKGGNASQRGDGMSFDVKGLDGAIGIDKRVNQNTLVGASVGLGNQDSKAKGMPGESKVNSVSVGLYGSHLAATNWFVNGGVSYTNHSVKTDRTVAARNASARLSGKTSGQTFGMFGEVGKRFGVSGVNIDPSVGVRVASTRLNAFDETNRDGQGTDGLKVGSQSQTSTRGVVGVRLWSEVASIAGGKVAPSLRLSYEHEFGNTQSSLTNAIYGAPSGFTVKGPKLGRDIFTADLGVDMQIKKQLEVRVGGNVSVRKGESALGGGISAKYRF